MADDDELIAPHGGGDHGHPPAGGVQASKKKRDMILIVIGVVGLVLTIIIFRRGSSSSTTATSPVSTTTSPGASTGTVAGYSGPSNGYSAQQTEAALNGFQSYLSNLATELTAGYTPPGGTVSQTPPAIGGSLASQGFSLITGGANAIQSDLSSGEQVFYAATPSSTPEQVSQAGAGAPWTGPGGASLSSLGGNPSGPAGAPSGFYTYAAPTNPGGAISTTAA